MFARIAGRAVSSSVQFVESGIDRYLAREIRRGNKTVFLGFISWKREFYRSVFKDKDIVFIGEDHYEYPRTIEAVFDCVKDQDVYVWSYKDPSWLSALSANNNCAICRLEDGFLRSVGLGAQRINPLSIIAERDSDLYFHNSRTSSLHRLIRALGPQDKQAFQEKGSALKDKILSNNVSKYSFRHREEKPEIPAGSIFVVGQVERDESIRRGPLPYFTCEQLVEIAMQENPGATVFYKPHPEVYKRIAKPFSAPFRRFSGLREFPQSADMFSCATGFKRVYTISSLVGFEMLLRGAAVSTFGAPWYAGWGPTDDRNMKVEEVPDITPEILLWAAYGVYPTYYTDAFEEADVFQVIDILRRQMNSGAGS